MTDKACFLLRIRPEHLPEYTRRHADLWPEMRAALDTAGYRNYSIFADESGLLVGYFEADDTARSAQRMAAHPVSTRWSEDIGWMFVSMDGARDTRDGHHWLQRVFDLDATRSAVRS
ncbi:L-rhamnose mutarotase [Microbacterium radiodurans]|uniref:L-rhamnose mutarotase n=1 Tax=Microbacterium radiodurans TaxID=661398 RepID=A0A5J5IQL2_9MICO|nr:L-rhamnose mutarotase [Microbacterium radiodurans]KAA9083748.1 L-rhamnose mutarotase [Microbacterium radiodurans]